MDFQKLVREKYSQEEEIKQFMEDAKRGLFLWEELVLKRFLKGQKRVLVLGSGGGREVFGLERMGIKAVGLDISIPQLQASLELQREFHSEAYFLACDCLNMPLKSGTFDACILYRQFLQHFPGVKNRRKLIEEVKRVLSYDGLIFLSVNLSPYSIGVKRLINYFYRWEKLRKKEVNPDKRSTFSAEGKSFLLQLLINILGTFVYGLRDIFRSFIKLVTGRYYKGLERGDYLISDISGAKSNGRVWFHSYSYDEVINELMTNGIEIQEVRDIIEIERGIKFPEFVRKGAKFISIVARKKV